VCVAAGLKLSEADMVPAGRQQLPPLEACLSEATRAKQPPRGYNDPYFNPYAAAATNFRSPDSVPCEAPIRHGAAVQGRA
jgi:hypothetical protein